MKIRWLFAATVATVPLLCVDPLLAQSSAGSETAQDGPTIRQALDDDAADFWIYEDVEAGFAESKRTGKPLLVSIR